MIYRVVMGFYPSCNSADKVMRKAKSFCRSVKVVKEDGCFVVVLGEFRTYEEADNLFSSCMKKKLFCGVQSLKNEI